VVLVRVDNQVLDVFRPLRHERLGDCKGRGAVGESDFDQRRRWFGYQEISQDIGLGGRERDALEVARRAGGTGTSLRQLSARSPDLLQQRELRAHLRRIHPVIGRSITAGYAVVQGRENPRATCAARLTSAIRRASSLVIRD
jgi:hypothetical protein